MSFAKDVKEELIKRTGNARHCRIAELAALIEDMGRTADEDGALEIKSENITAILHTADLIVKLFRFEPELVMQESGRQKIGSLKLSAKESGQLLQTLKIKPEADDRMSVTEAIVLQRSCCKRAYVRGQFLAAGTVNDPKKNYHLEFALSGEDKAKHLIDIISTFGIEAKMVKRKKNSVVYVKESSQISDILNLMEAHVALMQMENVRIYKDMRNSINRQVNCEAANITKTVNAAARQIDDIKFIEETVGFGELKPELAELAELRIRFPELSLKELGTMLSVPVGKSGVNHRLAKLSIIAEGLRGR